MNFYPYTITTVYEHVPQTFILRAKPAFKKISFLPGQYTFIHNPVFTVSFTPHPFSFASSPGSEELEFCIKTYGNWTKQLVRKRKGELIYCSEAQGNFVLGPQTKDVAFLLGGVGISPAMSILRNIMHTRNDSRITMLYGNRTPETVAYAQELANLQSRIPLLRVIHIYSEISNNHPWKGYRGFITGNIIRNEIDMSSNLTWFVIGPPIFVQKMKNILSSFEVKNQYIKEELLESKDVISSISIVSSSQRFDVGSFAETG